MYKRTIEADLRKHCYRKREICYILTKPNQTKVLTERFAQVDVTLYVSHSCVGPHRWAQ
jgi:hypothetical protein